LRVANSPSDLAFNFVIDVLPILSTLQKQVISSPTMTGQWNVIAVMETVMTRPLARIV
jgi:hypothetical protein